LLLRRKKEYRVNLEKRRTVHVGHPPPFLTTNEQKQKFQREKMMKTLVTICTAVIMIFVISGAAQANLGQIYTTANSIGTITPYRTLADAQAGTNAVSGPVDVGSHTLSLYFDTTADAPEGFEVYISTYSSWSLGEFQFFYSDAENAQNDCGIVSVPQMQFKNFDGTYWTEFQTTLQGGYKGSVLDWLMRGDYGNGWG
jgi:hypothetical protein